MMSVLVFCKVERGVGLDDFPEPWRFLESGEAALSEEVRLGSPNSEVKTRNFVFPLPPKGGEGEQKVP